MNKSTEKAKIKKVRAEHAAQCSSSGYIDVQWKKIPETYLLSQQHGVSFSQRYCALTLALSGGKGTAGGAPSGVCTPGLGH